MQRPLILLSYFVNGSIEEYFFSLAIKMKIVINNNKNRASIQTIISRKDIFLDINSW